MKQILRHEELSGKTIECVKYSEDERDVLFKFTDSTYAVLEAHYGMDNDIYLEFSNPYSLEPEMKNARDLLAFGIITQEHYDSILKEYFDSANEREKAKDVAEFKRLKDKYGW